jgi:hypothetical protein
VRQTRQGPSPWIARDGTVDHPIQEGGAIGLGWDGRDTLWCRRVLPVQLLQRAFELREHAPEAGRAIVIGQGVDR